MKAQETARNPFSQFKSVLQNVVGENVLSFCLPPTKLEKLVRENSMWCSFWRLSHTK